MEIMTKDNTSFEDWLAELDRVATADGFEGSYTDVTGAESWRDAYTAHETPATAWAYEKECAVQLGCVDD
jgi:hypothetical protein